MDLEPEDFEVFPEEDRIVLPELVPLLDPVPAPDRLVPNTVPPEDLVPELEGLWVFLAVSEPEPAALVDPVPKLALVVPSELPLLVAVLPLPVVLRVVLL